MPYKIISDKRFDDVFREISILIKKLFFNIKAFSLMENKKR
jgi:hypothetical protein